MDIVSLLKGFVGQLNDQDCGICYTFTLGGRSDYFNNKRQSFDDDQSLDCCAVITMENCKTIDIYSTDKEFSTLTHRDWILDLFIGLPSRPDIQFFDEVNPELVDQSIWANDLNPLQCCINNVSIDMCNIYDRCGCGNTSIEVRAWSMTMRIGYQDNHYNGWSINTTIRESIS